MTDKSQKFDRLCRELSLVVPRPNTVVHKTECLYSIDNEYSPDGIYVNLSTFESFGKEMLKFDRKYPKAVYLNIKKYLNPVNPEEDKECSKEEQELVYKEKKYFEEVTDYEIFSPELGTLHLLESPGDLLNICNAVISHSGYEFKNEELAWANVVEESKYAEDLYQVPNPPQVSHTNLKCQKCGSTTNLWLNLSDGYVGCGRKHYEGGGCQDGTEGAALLHYQETGCKYHLVVKIGTITATTADVYSYAKDEDNVVKDPYLDKHLSHFGIKIQLLEKTEKTTLQLELEKNQTHDWSDVVTQNGNETVVPVSQNFVGMLNLGNNCYINSVIQFLNNVKELNRYFMHYYNNFKNMNEDEILLQYSKICTSINTTKFVDQCKLNLENYKKKCEKNKIVYHNITGHNSFSVNPNLFKYSLSKRNYMFANNEQQDAEEFLSYFVDYLYETIDKKKEQSSVEYEEDFKVKSLFYFNVYQIIKCEDLKLINVNNNETHLMSLSLQNELRNSNKDFKEGEQEELDSTKEIHLNDCVRNWHNETEIEYMKEGNRHEATLRNSLVSLPEYLMVKLERFYMKSDWTPSKILNPVVVDPEGLELETFEKDQLEVYPDYKVEFNEDQRAFYEVDDSLLATLMSMGFTEYQIRRAYFGSKSKNADDCINWILSNDLNDISESMLLLKELGYQDESLNLKLLGYYGDDISSLMDYLSTTNQNSNNSNNSNSNESNQVGGSENEKEKGLGRRKKGKYELLGFITHIGSTINSGHYVCHLKKNKEWYLFNDTKIHTCKNPPVEKGYIYLFKLSN